MVMKVVTRGAWSRESEREREGKEAYAAVVRRDEVILDV